jgi:hypothetical protein
MAFLLSLKERKINYIIGYMAFLSAPSCNSHTKILIFVFRYNITGRPEKWNIEILDPKEYFL